MGSSTGAPIDTTSVDRLIEEITSLRVQLEPHPKKNPQTGRPDGKYTVEIVEWVD
jgi:hypothetical protein